MCSVEGVVSLAKQYGYTSLAITDRNVLAGAMAFRKACEKAGIRPVYGLEVTVAFQDMEHDVLLYAKDDDGYRDLMKLSSLICTGNSTVIDPETLRQHSSHNIICLFSDDMPLTSILDRGIDPAATLRYQKEVLGEYIVALADHDIAINAQRDRRLKEILKGNGILTVALNRTFYLHRDDVQEYDVLKCIRDRKTVNESETLDSGRYLLRQEEFDLLYDRDDLINSDLIASRCYVSMDFKTSLPHYQNRNGIPSRDYLVSLCKEGLRRRLKGKADDIYKQRLEYELSVILKMHFEDYFLIVYDFILYAKKNGILVGPGRGSAAGSLVSYCLGITEIDPIRYGLIFERFLNPERISMPDIDTDFPDDRRDEVIAYVKQRYGEEHVGHIITYGTLKAKQVLRDVGRALDYQNREIDAICKLIPNVTDMDLQKAYDTVPLFRQRIESDSRYGSSIRSPANWNSIRAMNRRMPPASSCLHCL